MTHTDLFTRTERGSGMLSSTLGLLYFLGFLTLTTQLTTSLYRTSVATGVAHDAAHAAAGARFEAGEVCDEAMLELARERATRLLGAARSAHITANCLGPDLQVSVSLRKPALLALGGRTDITRTVLVLAEHVVEEE